MTADVDKADVRLRTPIRVQRKTVKRVSGQLDPTVDWLDIGTTTPDEPPQYKRCQWTNAHGAESIRDNLVSGVMTATIIVRWDPRIDATCRVTCGDEVWRITSVDDVRAQHRWMEITLERTVKA